MKRKETSNTERPTPNIERRMSQLREARPFTRANFFEIVKANFVAAREIMIEFVFSLWENGFVPGSATAPHRDGFNNPPDTRPAR